MRLLTLTIVACTVATSAGCSTVQGWSEDAYVVRTATPDSMTLEFRPGNLNVATERAQAHCKDSGRSAKMQNVSTTDGKSVATFNCQY